MNTTYDKPVSSRYSTRNTSKPVNFYCSASKAKTVYLMGDFNDWNATSHQMERRDDRWWTVQMSLSHGHHLYLFLVDGEKTLDPHSTGISRNEHNEPSSMIAVS